MEDSDNVSHELESFLNLEMPDIDPISENMTTMLSKSRRYYVVDGMVIVKKRKGILSSVSLSLSLQTPP